MALQPFRPHRKKTKCPFWWTYCTVLNLFFLLSIFPFILIGLFTELYFFFLLLSVFFPWVCFYWYVRTFWQDNGYVLTKFTLVQFLMDMFWPESVTASNIKNIILLCFCHVPSRHQQGRATWARGFDDLMMTTICLLITSYTQSRPCYIYVFISV